MRWCWGCQAPARRLSSVPPCAACWPPGKLCSSRHTRTGAASAERVSGRMHATVRQCVTVPAPHLHASDVPSSEVSWLVSAVDNILLRLRAAGLPVLRLGRADSVHASLRDCLPGGGLWPDTSVAKLRSLARCAGVVRRHTRVHPPYCPACIKDRVMLGLSVPVATCRRWAPRHWA